MPLIGALLVNLVGGLAAFFGTTVLKRFAFYIAAATAVAAAFGGMLLTINGIVAGLSKLLPDIVTIGASWFFPTNLNQCIAARVSASVAIAIYRWHMNILLRASSS